MIVQKRHFEKLSSKKAGLTKGAERGFLNENDFMSVFGKRHAEPQLTLVSRERSEEHRDARALCSDAYAAR